MPRGSLRHYSSHGRRSSVQRDTALVCLILAIVVNFLGLYLTHRMLLATFEPFEPRERPPEVLEFGLYEPDEIGEWRKQFRQYMLSALNLPIEIPGSPTWLARRARAGRGRGAPEMSGCAGSTARHKPKSGRPRPEAAIMRPTSEQRPRPAGAAPRPARHRDPRAARPGCHPS